MSFTASRRILLLRWIDQILVGDVKQENMPAIDLLFNGWKGNAKLQTRGQAFANKL